ncbi:MAG: NACHT domain-containing protein [Desulfobaccales bacterium]
MTEEFDPNKIAVDFLQKNIDSIGKIIKGLMKGTADQVRLHLDNTYKDYIKTILERYSKVKSFFIRNEPVHLYNYYVPLTLSFRNKHLKKIGILDVIEISRFSIITGSAGSGKSMLMRHLLINALFIKEKVPVFIELRQMNQEDDDLRSIIQKVLFANKFRLEGEFIEKALEAGHFVIFLDGFDEINLSKKQAIGQQIISFTEKYSDNWIVISSRPDNLLEGWAGFAVSKVDPLNIDQAQDLIRKLPYDDELKAKFIEDLRKELFKQHESFLSNPLLLSIMLLTYGQGAHIPTKLNVFYNQAYEALFQRHDALKGGFQRERCTQLDIQDYAKVFSTFCLQTYDKTEFQFSRMEALEYITKAKGITQLEYDSEDYLNDALQAVCLLVEEGLMIVFVHRSFQEYFTSRFIAECKSEIQKLLIDKYAKNSITDTVIKLLYEIRPDIVDHYYILPKINELRQFMKLKDKIGMSHYIRFIKSQYKSFEIDQGEGLFGYYNNKYRDDLDELISFVLENCGHLVGWKGYNLAERHFFRNKYNPTKMIKSFQTKDFTTSNQFVKDLAEKGGAFAMGPFQAIFEIEKILKARERSADISLMKILGERKRT